MSWKKQCERGFELLELCQQYQSEKDGVERPEFGKVDKTKSFDTFAREIHDAQLLILAIHKMMPLMMDLTQLGKKLEEDGLITVDYGDDYSREALDYLMELHKVSPEKETNQPKL